MYMIKLTIVRLGLKILNILAVIQSCKFVLASRSNSFTNFNTLLMVHLKLLSPRTQLGYV